MTEIVHLDRVDIAFGHWDWPFARERREDIGRHFAQRQRERPGIWNGRVLLLNHHAVDRSTLNGTCFETDFASFLAWRDWGFPDRSVTNFFAAGAVRTCDGAYVLGEMGPHTSAAGLIYFPCGTPDPGDLVAGRVDLMGSIGRELREETGLDIAELAIEADWTVVRDGCYLGIIKRLGARASAQSMHADLTRLLAQQRQPELSAIHIMRGPADFRPGMAPYAAAFLTDAWQRC